MEHRPSTAAPTSTMAPANRLLTTFYVGVALAALVGQTLAAVNWLGWPWLFAGAAVALVELGGIALAAFADARRRLRERALVARLLSAVVASGAVALNWLGHTDRLAGGFFAGLSALGYTVWIIAAEARRRDRIRAECGMAHPPPVYQVGQWLRHPWITLRARSAAETNPGLTMPQSLLVAEAAVRTEKRNAALATALRQRIESAVDPTMAQIAVLTFDLDQIAERLRRDADYDRLTALLAADLDPDRLTGDGNGRCLPIGSPAARATTAATPEPAPHRTVRDRGASARRPSAADMKRRMREYAESRQAAGLAVTGADLDREFHTTDYGRKVLRELGSAQENSDG